MERNSMGCTGLILSVIFLILGTTFLFAEPIDAAPTASAASHQGHREQRSPSPDPRCPSCPKDCPERLAGGIPTERGSADERRQQQPQQYSPVAKSAYPTPVAYNSIHQSPYAAQPPSPTYATVPQPAAAPVYVAAPPPPDPYYAAAPVASYAAYPQTPTAYAAYAVPPVATAYAAPVPLQPTYAAPVAPVSYSPPAELPQASYSPIPVSTAYSPSALAPVPYNPPLSPPSAPQPPQPQTSLPTSPSRAEAPSPQASYSPPPAPSYVYPSTSTTVYNPSLSSLPYSSAPCQPTQPASQPLATEKPDATASASPEQSTASSPSIKPSSSSQSKLPPSPAIPNEPPLPDSLSYKAPAPSTPLSQPAVPAVPSAPTAPATVPVPAYNHLINPWTRASSPFRSFNHNPYAAPEYRSNYLNPRPSCPCTCGGSGFDLDDEEDEDDIVFNKFNRRPSDNRYYRHSADPLGSPSTMYKNYRPYERDYGGYNANEYASDELQSNKKQPRERLYVVYRADANKDSKAPSTPINGYLTDDRFISDREIDTVIRRAIDLTRQQRSSQQDSVPYNRPDPRYQYQRVSQEPQQFDEEPEFKSLAQQQQQQQQQTQQQSPIQMMDNEALHVVKEDGDEANNPGSDQSKWTAVPPVSADFDNPENVYAANVALSNGAVATIAVTTPAAVATPPVEVVKELVVIQANERPETKETVEPPKATESKTEVVDLIEDMETPQTVTEASSYDRHAEMTTDHGAETS